MAPDARFPRWSFRLLAFLLTSAACLLILEGFARALPDVLPGWYRASLPVAGIELFQPGVLASTPIHGVPIPYRFSRRSEFRGGPPQDLQDIGLVAAADNPDPERYPEIRFRFDRWGLANPADRELADVVLAGDSYTRAMGALAPLGLQARLERRTDLVTFNLGIPAIGPQRTAWLLDELGLARRPRAVIWFFFGGNDLADAAAVDRHRAAGVRTHADLFETPDLPRSVLLDLLAKTASRPEAPRPPAAPLPGFSLPAAGGERRIWFYPEYLRQLARSRQQLAADPGWAIATRVLARVAADLERRSIRLLVVYLPSKPQVYLPAVRPDPALAYRVAGFGAAPPKGSAADFWHLALARRGELESLLEDFCNPRGIAFLSLTGPLSDLAHRGELGYFAADTHWNEVGQAAAVEPLAGWLSESHRH